MLEFSSNIILYYSIVWFTINLYKMATVSLPDKKHWKIWWSTFCLDYNRRLFEIYFSVFLFLHFRLRIVTKIGVRVRFVCFLPRNIGKCDFVISLFVTASLELTDLWSAHHVSSSFWLCRSGLKLPKFPAMVGWRFKAYCFELLLWNAALVSLLMLYLMSL